jgi:hypothetical protein
MNHCATEHSAQEGEYCFLHNDVELSDSDILLAKIKIKNETTIVFDKITSVVTVLLKPTSIFCSDTVGVSCRTPA